MMEHKLDFSRVAAFTFMMLLGFSHPSLSYGEESSAAVVVTDKSIAGELNFWNTIKNSKNSADFKAYLTNFPNGMFFDPAMQMFEATGGSKADLPSFANVNPKPEAPVKTQNSTVEKKKQPVKKTASKTKKKKKSKASAQQTVSKSQKAKNATKVVQKTVKANNKRRHTSGIGQEASGPSSGSMGGSSNGGGGTSSSGSSSSGASGWGL